MTMARGGAEAARRVSWVLVLGAVLGAAGCAGRRDAIRPDSLWQQYHRALADARLPERSEIAKDLLPVLPDEERLAWKDGRVLMVTWTRSKWYSDPAFEKGYEFPLYATTWFTPFPEVRDFCIEYRGRDLAMRMRQLIGLPPDSDHDAFLEVWVRPEDLFRPCLDPEITDSQCQVRIPLVESSPPKPGDDRAPWRCPLPGAAARQQGERFSKVEPSHLAWMCENWIRSHSNDDPKKNYPWTALGYTYDWGDPRNPRGPSEYASHKGSIVVFERLASTEAYCGR